MGRAKIISHDGDGLYTVDYTRDTDKIDAQKADLITQLESVNSEIANITADINLAYYDWDNARDDLSSAIDDYSTCLRDAKDPLNHDCDDSLVIEYTAITTEKQAFLNLKEGEKQLLVIQRDSITKKIDVYKNAPKSSEQIQIWCIDLCARESAQPPVGDWENVGEVIPVDTIVGTIEIFNYTTKEYDIRILPNSYLHDASYNSAEHGIMKPSLSSNAEGFVYNFELRAMTYKYRSQYRVATITEVNPDDTFMSVKFDPDETDEHGNLLNDQLITSGIGTNNDVTIDYMDCANSHHPASAFDFGNQVIIRFDVDYLQSPVCIGFAERPLRCPPTLAFIWYCAWTVKQYIVTYNESTGLWNCSQTTRRHGTKFWNRQRDGAYVSFGHALSIEYYSNGMQSEKFNVYVGSSRYTVPSAMQSEWISAMAGGLDINDELWMLVYRPDGGYNGVAIWHYDWVDWEIAVEVDLPDNCYNNSVHTSSTFMNENGEYFAMDGSEYSLRLYLDGTIEIVDEYLTYVKSGSRFSYSLPWQGFYKDDNGDWVGGGASYNRGVDQWCEPPNVIEKYWQTGFEVQQGFPAKDDLTTICLGEQSGGYPADIIHYARTGTMLHNKLWVRRIWETKTSNGYLTWTWQKTTAAGAIVEDYERDYTGFWCTGGSSCNTSWTPWSDQSTSTAKFLWVLSHAYISQRKQWQANGVWCGSAINDPGEGGAYNTTASEFLAVLQAGGVSGGFGTNSYNYCLGYTTGYKK